VASPQVGGLPRQCGTDTRGDAALLAGMVGNLVDNAVVHNGDGGWMRLTAARDDDAVRLAVEAGGPVLDQQEVDELALPFRRLGGDRTGSGSGTGLGLSIVAAIAADAVT